MKILIASSEKNIVEERVAVYSLISSGHNETDIKIIDADKKIIYDWRRKNIEKRFNNNDKDKNFGLTTSFTLARLFIPFIYNKENVVIIDPDVLVFKNLKALFLTNNEDGVYLRKAYKPEYWATSVFAYKANYFNESRLLLFKSALDDPEMEWEDKIYMTNKFVRKANIKINCISKNWNRFDQVTSNTNIVHFTNLYSQPWIHHDHPLEYQWFQYAKKALEKNILTIENIETQINLTTTFSEDIRALRADFKEKLNNNVDPDSISKLRNYFVMFKKNILFHSPRKYFYTSFFT